MNGRLELQPTRIAGLTLIKRKPLGDARGFLERLYCATELRAAGLTKSIRQINRTFTQRRGTVRGLHFQHAPAMETKIVSCLRGRVFDVAVDLRAGSATFLDWFGIELSADNGQTLMIPEGFAHGLQTLEDDCEMLYLHTEDYAAHAEGGLSALDPRIAIAWPLAITEMSTRDQTLPTLDHGFTGLAP